MRSSTVIAVDFDGTIVEHKYPDIGNPAPYALSTLKELQQQGHKIILLTMRSGRELQEAVEYCRKQGLEFWAVNENPEQKLWTDSAKVYAHIYIDDAAFGAPLRPASEAGLRPVVDWEPIKKKLAI